MFLIEKYFLLIVHYLPFNFSGWKYWSRFLRSYYQTLYPIFVDLMKMKCIQTQNQNTKKAVDHRS